MASAIHICNRQESTLTGKTGYLKADVRSIGKQS